MPFLLLFLSFIILFSPVQSYYLLFVSSIFSSNNLAFFFLFDLSNVFTFLYPSRSLSFSFHFHIFLLIPLIFVFFLLSFECFMMLFFHLTSKSLFGFETFKRYWKCFSFFVIKKHELEQKFLHSFYQ